MIGRLSSKSILQVAPSPYSNIRVIRAGSGDGRLLKCLADDSLFHHQFWLQNNREFERIEDEGEYRQFVIGKSQAFKSYNRECWRRNGRTILAGYNDLFERIRDSLRLRAVIIKRVN